MSLVMRGGRPHTIRIVVPSQGGRWALPANSSELIFRTLSGTARVYWTEKDFHDDPDGTLSTASCATLNGDTNYGEFRLRASVGDIWLRGEGTEIELTIIGAQT